MLNPNPLRTRLTWLYGEKSAEVLLQSILESVKRHLPNLPPPLMRNLDQRDAILIAYGDQVQQPGESPLCTLASFCSNHLKGLVNTIHILPFYPYSSDDGFSVIDYRAVDPALGGWEDVARLRREFRLMFDAVINHISAQSAWFQGYLRGDPRYRNYFIEVKGSPDLSKVARPRALPLLTRFSASSGEKALWTTFSSDQIDLNYHNPQVLLEMLDLLLFYVTQGAEFIRLDAIAYLWKEIGTTCIHQPQVHWIIQIMRAMLDQLAPQVRLITETNVPHKENISYFGDGTNEAHMVYNFTLPPLVLHTLYQGDAVALTRWARSLELPSNQVTYLNFLASHDGIGVTPLHAILPESAIEALVNHVQTQGGLVSYRTNVDGSQSPYELNINYFDALSLPGEEESLDMNIRRFVVAHAIAFSLVGVPGIYFHSLFGSQGWLEGVRLHRQNRAINRQKLTLLELEDALMDTNSLRSRVFNHLSRLLHARASHPAFAPTGNQKILDCGAQVFGLIRSIPGEHRRVLCLHNVSAKPAHIVHLPNDVKRNKDDWFDFIGGKKFTISNAGELVLAPYQSVWLALDEPGDNPDAREDKESL